MDQSPAIGDLVLDSIRATFRGQKAFAERAIVQLDDEQLRTSLDENTNSVAVIMKHMAGNMLSRWTDFLTSDGEKPWRDRDREFEDDFPSRQAVLDYWERGWACLLATVDRLTADDLARSVAIRGEPLRVITALDRQVSHYGYHVGQIVLIARVLCRDQWTVLTVARGESQAYNRRVWRSPSQQQPGQQQQQGQQQHGQQQ